MKIIKRQKFNINDQVEYYGIESIKEDSLINLIDEIRIKNSSNFLIATTPSDVLIDENLNYPSVCIEKLFFYKEVSDIALRKILKAEYIEELIFLFVKDISSFSKEYEKHSMTLKKNISADPYSSIKELCLIEGVIVVFYSPDDADVDLFVKKRRSNSNSRIGLNFGTLSLVL